MSKVENKPGVYRITNQINQKVYVGSSTNLAQRKSEHFCKKHNKNPGLREDMKAYGKEAFQFEVLEECKQEHCVAVEQTFIDYYKRLLGWENLYNASPTAGSPLGVKHSEETKQKISEAKRDQTIYNFVHKSGKTFQGTQYELRTKEGLDSGHLSKVILGNRKYKSTGGWSVVR
jgi:group I intron endonuclease